MAASPNSHRVLVDMTPLGPGGRNGGAGLVATALVSHLAELEPAWEFTLLTAADSHAELGALDRANVRRQCVVDRGPSRSLPRRMADALLPPRARVGLKRWYWALRTSREYRQVADALRPDVLVCPFTVPYFWRAGVPTISIVYDLQHLAYRDFFTPEQWLNRQHHLEQVCAHADRIVCISEYVERTLVEHFPRCAGSAETIPLGVLREAVSPDRGVVDRLGLGTSAFLVYPANFWPHKNHRRLFAALELHAERNPQRSVRLVCTGAPNALMKELQAEAAASLGDSVLFAGYVSSAELVALLDASIALIFPSLYEGFGMPVLEAMARGTPVLCSNVTSLPEVAGDAAILFDPTDVHAMAAAIDRLQSDPRRIAGLVSAGQQRASAFGGAPEMAARYRAVLRDTLQVSV